MFRQSTLDRSCSVMGLWILTLTITLGVLMGEHSSRQEQPAAHASHRLLNGRLPSIPATWWKTVFVLKSPTTWIATASDWSRSNSPRTWNDLSQKRPFERTNEPDFCELTPNPLTADLSIKLTRHYASNSINPSQFLNLIAEFPFEHDLKATADRKEPNFHGAFISGAAYLR